MKKEKTSVILSHITKSFGEKEVLRDLSLTLTPDTIYCLMGASGSGKTTLFRIILGLDTPDETEGVFPIMEGIPSRIGCQFQEDRLCTDFSVRSNLRLARKGVSDKEIAEHLSAVGLEKELHTAVRHLSGGMRRRVSLVRAILSDAPLILLDEPFQGLDDHHRTEAAAYIRRYTKGKTVLIVTHDEEDAQRLSAILVQFEDLQKK